MGYVSLPEGNTFTKTDISKFVLHSLKLTASLPLKINSCKMSCLLGQPIFRGELLVFGMVFFTNILNEKLPILKQKTSFGTRQQANHEHLFGHLGDVHGCTGKRPRYGQKTQGNLWFNRPTNPTLSCLFCKKMTFVDQIWLL